MTQLPKKSNDSGTKHISATDAFSKDTEDLLKSLKQPRFTKTQKDKRFLLINQLLGAQTPEDMTAALTAADVWLRKFPSDVAMAQISNNVQQRQQAALLTHH